MVFWSVSRPPRSSKEWAYSHSSPGFLYYWGYLHTGSKASRLHFAIFNAFHRLHCAPFILSHSRARPLFGHPEHWRSVSPSEQISAGQIPCSPLCAETALLLSSLQPIDLGHLQADVPLRCYSPRAHTTFSSFSSIPKAKNCSGGEWVLYFEMHRAKLCQQTPVGIWACAHIMAVSTETAIFFYYYYFGYS